MNKMFSTKRIAFMGIAAALAVVLIYLTRFPAPPPFTFLEYTAGDVPIYLCTFLFGLLPGMVVNFVAAIIQGITVSAGSGWIGILGNLFSTGVFVIVSGLIYRKGNSFKRLLCASGIGFVSVIVAMIGWNLIFTPIFMGIDIAGVILSLPAIILFNVIKVSINAAVSVVIYKSVGRFIKA